MDAVPRLRLWFTLGTGLALTISAAAQVPLRYGLEVGNHLIYDYRVSVRTLDANEIVESYAEQIQLWVIGRAGQRLRLIGECVHVERDRLGPARAAAFFCDTRGRLELTREMRRELSDYRPLLWLLPELPPAFDSGLRWTTKPAPDGLRLRCRRAGTDPERGGAAKIEFAVEDTFGVWKTLGIELHGTFWFDTAAGRVVRLQYERTDRRRGRRTVVTARLYEQRQVARRWCELRQPLIDKHLLTLRLEQRLRDRLGREPRLGPQIIEAMQRVWTERLRELAGQEADPFDRWVRSRKRWLKTRTPDYRKQAALAARWKRQKLVLAGTADAGRRTVVYYFDPRSEQHLRGLVELERQIEAVQKAGWRVVAIVAGATGDDPRTALAPLAPHVELRRSAAPIGDVGPVYRLLDEQGRTSSVRFGWWPGAVLDITGASGE